jgi:HEAT repeat protein
MSGFPRVCAVALSVALTAPIQFAIAQDHEPLNSLMLRFREARDIIEKERILNRITQRGNDAGRLLLQLAKSTEEDGDTRWLAIRGLGTLKFEDAAPFLTESLQSEEHYVRANAARALGEIRYSPAAPALINLLNSDQDSGVIEQTSLALRMIRAEDAVPVLRSRMSFNSSQTRCWLLQAIASLGSKNDVPFIAKYLYEPDIALGGVPLCAAGAIAAVTGEDFGLPHGGGIFDPRAPVLKARTWWELVREQYVPE